MEIDEIAHRKYTMREKPRPGIEHLRNGLRIKSLQEDRGGEVTKLGRKSECWSLKA